MATCDEEESLTERQENELQALKAIYFDVKDLRENDAWGVTRPPEIQITLFPLESMGGTKAHVSIDLLVKCSPTYPDVVPELQLDNAKGISTQQLEALGEELRSMARERVGEVMLLELCQHVQSCLHAHNKAPKSFYEEMMLNQRREQKRAAQEQQRHNELQCRREQKQVQEIEEEIQRRDEAQKEETRRRREGMNKTTSEPVTPELDSPPMESHQRVPLSPQRSMNGDGGRRQERRSASLERRTSTPLCGQGDERTCDLHTGTTTLTFNTKRECSVHRGKCLGHSDQGSTTYTAMDTHSGELLAVSEWTLQWQKRWSEPAEIASYMKQVTSIEQELLSLLRLRHTHLVHYHALHCHQDHDSITVHVLMDYVGGGSLSRCLVQAEPVPMPLLRHYTCQLLETFTYLHDKAVVHKDLRASSVLLDSSGNIRLADYSLNKRLSDLVAKFQRHIALNSQHAPVIARGTKKGDVYSLGVVLLSLCQGRSVADLVVDLPTNLPRDFHDFLSMCLIRDERSRWSMQQLLDHSFVKLPLLLTVTMTTKGSGASLDRKQEGSLEEDEEGSVNIPFIPSTDSGSRLQNEFEILKFIGKGGFGDVIKVRNKLDTRLYAIKRIPLNPGNKTFTRKITREVKLLSQLNHENVVRYINSWIETSNDPILSDSTSTSTATSDLCVVHPKIQHIINSTMHQNSLGLRDDIEKFAPAPIIEGSIEWSVSADIVGSHGNNEESSSEEEDDIEDVFGRSFLPFLDSDDDGIEFQSDSVDEGKNRKEVEESEVSIERRHEGETPDSVPKLQFLYIQMEFCEKSTLRTCIDTGLYEDVARVWRLFREVVDGLVHIHEQGIIHRDLKPVNIFLDLNDQVKIGDFGLATTDIISRLGPPSGVLEVSFNSDPQVSMSRSGSVGDGNLTGKVGTALYVSPEMMDTTAKAHYDQKVDIYSLGVIFFEMCTPMATGMERVKVLSALRLPSIDFPPEFDEVELEQQVKMIRWLLNHDPGLRPTSLELLQSKLLPPPQLQEAELNEVLRSTISNPDSKSYKHMVAAMFSQDPVPAKDFVYDNDFYKSAFCSTLPLLQRYVTDTVEGIFRKHGAVRLSTPLLVPQSSVYDRCESYVCVMARHGSLITLPYDLRIHFARYLAHSNITQLKRYSIERVYREAPLLGAHPRELMACAFDIVTPSPAGLVPDAEVLHVAWELVAEFPVLQARNYYVRMNHTALLRAVLIYSGVSEELHHDVCAILGDNKAEKQKKFQIKTRLQGLSLSVHTVKTLYNFIEAEDVFSRVASMLRCITKTNGPAAAYAKKGLHEMEALVVHMDSLGVKWRVVLAPGLVYNTHHFSGIVFQVVSNVQRKKKTVMEVLAAGGRYDHLINEFRKSRNAPSFQFAVGISVSYDRMVAALQEQKDFVPPTRTDVLVCTLGHRMLVKEKLSLVKDLWNVGLRADIAHDATWSLEELQAYCRTSGILYIVLLKDLESGTVRVRSLERDKYIEKKVNLAEVADYLQQRLQTLKWETTESGQNSTGKMPNVPSQGSSEPPSHVGNTSNSLPQFTMTFLQSDNTKLSKNTKRTYEAQIYSAVSSALVHISQRALVEILGLDLNGDVLKTIAAYLELDDDEAVFEKSLSSIIEKHLRYRKYLTKIFDYIHEQKYAKSCSVFVIFGLKDNSYKVLILS